MYIQYDSVHILTCSSSKMVAKVKFKKTFTMNQTVFIQNVYFTENFALIQQIPSEQQNYVAIMQTLKNVYIYIYYIKQHKR